ncbi:MAG: hypothetical protein ABEJ67_04205 [Halanaeroarchaeum sp.]
MSPDPASVVADADVLAADLFGEETARAAMDRIREHSWVTLVASDPLLDDAAAVVAALADADLAADWRERVSAEARIVEHPDGDHPAFAAALHGEAAHVLSLDESLTSAAGNVAISARVRTSVRTPDAFVRIFDPEALYEAVEGGSYPGPDTPPRA